MPVPKKWEAASHPYYWLHTIYKNIFRWQMRTIQPAGYYNTTILLIRYARLEKYPYLLPSQDLEY